jgi:hypothetical protein
MLEINNGRKAIAAEIYWQIQDEIDQKRIIDYIYNDCLIEDSKLTKWAAAKISLGKAVVIKRFKPKDITLAQNLSRAIQFVRRAASTSAYNISEADVKHIHAMISENLVDNPGEYRTNNIPDAAPKWFEIPRTPKIVQNQLSRLQWHGIKLQISSTTDMPNRIIVSKFCDFRNMKSFYLVDHNVSALSSLLRIILLSRF